jgi:hypothetical protein
MKTFVTRYPILFALVVSLTGMLSQMTPIWLPGVSVAVQVFVARVAGCLIAVALLLALNWWQEAGFIRFAS